MRLLEEEPQGSLASLQVPEVMSKEKSVSMSLPASATHLLQLARTALSLLWKKCTTYGRYIMETFEGSHISIDLSMMSNVSVCAFCAP